MLQNNCQLYVITAYFKIVEALSFEFWETLKIQIIIYCRTDVSDTNTSDKRYILFVRTNHICSLWCALHLWKVLQKSYSIIFKLLMPLENRRLCIEAVSWINRDFYASPFVHQHHSRSPDWMKLPNYTFVLVVLKNPFEKRIRRNFN